MQTGTHVVVPFNFPTVISACHYCGKIHRFFLFRRIILRNLIIQRRVPYAFAVFGRYGDKAFIVLLKAIIRGVIILLNNRAFGITEQLFKAHFILSRILNKLIGQGLRGLPKFCIAAYNNVLVILFRVLTACRGRRIGHRGIILVGLIGLRGTAFRIAAVDHAVKSRHAEVRKYAYDQPANNKTACKSGKSLAVSFGILTPCYGVFNAEKHGFFPRYRRDKQQRRKRQDKCIRQKPRYNDCRKEKPQRRRL